MAIQYRKEQTLKKIREGSSENALRIVQRIHIREKNSIPPLSDMMHALQFHPESACYVVVCR